MSTEQFTRYLNVSINCTMVGMSNFSAVFQQPMSTAPSCMHASGVPRFQFRSSFFSTVSVPSAEIAVCARRVAPPTSISNIQSVEGREQFSPAFCGI